MLNTIQQYDKTIAKATKLAAASKIFDCSVIFDTLLPPLPAEEGVQASEEGDTIVGEGDQASEEGAAIVGEGVKLGEREGDGGTNPDAFPAGLGVCDPGRVVFELFPAGDGLDILFYRERKAYITQGSNPTPAKSVN